MRQAINQILLLMLSSIFNISFAQGAHSGFYNPDSLEVVTVDGYAIVDTAIGMHTMYYLDEDNNGSPDYFLNFGPWWYEPDSSIATRPNNEDIITIKGGKMDSTMFNSYPMIIVYKINGLFWRDPYDSFWNHMGHHGANGGHDLDSCHISGFGWMHDPPQSISVSGYALTDTTFMMEHYYLDEDNNGTPEYFLNFGPPWYEPESGAIRPDDGDPVDIVGGLIENGNYSMIIVYEINGLEWRDSTSFGGHMGGGWMHRNMTAPENFHTPFDTLDIVTMNPGWWNGGGHHGGMHDSLFCQFLEIVPGDIYTLGSENAFAAYEMDYYYPMMMGGGMNNQMGCGGHMNFNSTANFQFHYTEEQLTSANIIESSIAVKYWDGDIDQWNVVSGVVLNTTDNLITFNEATVGNFFILTGDSPTLVEDTKSVIPDQFMLRQNFPNPFNPSTTIEFSLPKRANIQLIVYNILGKKVAELARGNYEAGNYSIQFDAKSLPSGVYFYQLKTSNFDIVKKMQLIK